MTDKKKNGWIKFVPSLDLPKERVSIAYDTHDERGYRFAYGYFQFYNGTCDCFWKDGNEQPKVVKAEDIKYWMPVPSLDVQEEPISEDLETEIDNISEKYRGLESLCEHDVVEICEHFFKFGTQWKEQQMMAKAFDFTKEHNTACVLASECLRNHGWFNRERVFNDLFRHLSCVDKLFEGKFSGKTKVIVIKEV